MNQEQKRKPITAETPDPSLQGLENTTSDARHLRRDMDQVQEQEEKYKKARKLIEERGMLTEAFEFTQTIGQ
jgi:hypothetical protein